MKIAPTYGPAASCILAGFAGAFIAVGALYLSVLAGGALPNGPLPLIGAVYVGPALLFGSFVGMVSTYANKSTTGMLIGVLIVLIGYSLLLSVIMISSKAGTIAQVIGIINATWKRAACALLIGAVAGAIGGHTSLTEEKRGVALRFRVRELMVAVVIATIVLTIIKSIVAG